ncbi:MAG: AMP-binding protein, partial [Pseudomonadota bacterium]
KDAATAESSDPACIVYTSGTTGRPKGAVLTHHALLSSADRIAYDMLKLHAGDRTLVVMPLFHVGGMWYHGFPNFMVGAEITIQSVFRPDAVLAAIADKQITNTHLAPTMVSDILDRERTPDAAASLERILYAASPMPVTTLKKAMAQFPTTEFVQSYGSTEGGPICRLSHDDHLHAIAEREEILRSCGKPFKGVELKLAATDGSDAAPGEIGEILIRSSSTTLAYWGNASATKDTIADGWVATGDLGRLDEEGFVYIADRKKDMIISGGENVYPIEVENVLYEVPGVEDVAVIGVPDDRWVERVVACVIPSDGAAPSEDFIIAESKKRLSSYKCPKEVRFLTDFPKNAAGKILKRRLAEDYPFDTD